MLCWDSKAPTVVGSSTPWVTHLSHYQRKKHLPCRLKRRTEKTFCTERYQCKYKSSPRILCTEWRLKSTLDVFVRPRKEAILEQAHHFGFTWSWNDVTVRGGGKSWFVYVPLLWDISEQAQGVFKVSNNVRLVPWTFAACGRILSRNMTSIGD